MSQFIDTCTYNHFVSHRFPAARANITGITYALVYAVDAVESLTATLRICRSLQEFVVSSHPKPDLRT